jgi:hypothetical protein
MAESEREDPADVSARIWIEEEKAPQDWASHGRLTCPNAIACQVNFTE